LNISFKHNLLIFVFKGEFKITERPYTMQEVTKALNENRVGILINVLQIFSLKCS
jgi:hypothetical protein